MHCKIITKEQTLYDGQAQAVTLPGTAGEMTVLPGHTFLVSELKVGTIRVQQGPSGQAQTIPVKGGIVEVQDNQALVLVR